MSDNKYCAVNTKYYKDSNANGEIGHIQRNFIDNKNSIESLKKNNFGFCFGDGNLKEFYDKRLNDAKKANPFAIQKNSNTYIDSVLVFNRELFDECISFGQEDRIIELTKNYMLDFKEKYGFEPIGFEFHLDEGTVISSSKFEKLSDLEKKEYKVLHEDSFVPENPDYIKHNYHAHAIFLNYDFEKNKSCLRNMQKKDWSNSQDLLFKQFKKLGFDRGESKLVTKNEHKEKIDYVAELQEKEKELMENRMSHLIEKSRFLDVLEEYGNFKDDVSQILRLEKTKIFPKLLEFIKKTLKPEFIEKIENSLNRIKEILGSSDEPGGQPFDIYDQEPDEINNEFTSRFPASSEAEKRRIRERQAEDERLKKEANEELIKQKELENQEKLERIKKANNRRNFSKPALKMKM